MLSSYIKLAIRSLFKNKLYAVITVSGLAIDRDFLLLILIAFAIATQASVFIFKEWLSSFAYHIALKPVFFILAVSVVILISWITLAFQMIRASRINPAVVLKSE